MKMLKLSEICNPKQWKTISSRDLTIKGYPVYGANGIIGYTSTYNHEKETLLVTCRGATCGSLNISEPFSYVNGNAMALDDLKEELVSLKYLYYYLSFRGFSDVISGSAQPQIIRSAINRIEVPIPSMTHQQKVVDLLERTELIIKKRKFQIASLDKLTQSIFFEVFGNPIENDKSWSVDKLENVIEPGTSVSYGIVQTGDGIKEGVPVIRPVDFTKKIDVRSLKKTTYDISNSYSRTILKGNELLVTVRANIGSVMLSTPEMKGINVTRGITPLTFNRELINPYFALVLFKSISMQRLLKRLSKGITLIQLNMRDLREIPIIIPPLDIQNHFAERYLMIEKLREDIIKSKKELENLYNSLLQKALSGELFQDE